MAETATEPTTTEAEPVEATEVTPDKTPDTPAVPDTGATGDTPAHWSRGDALGFDADTIGWLENKGFESPQAAITSQRELEKKMGGPPEMLQKWPESDDTEGFESIHQRLGKPETVEGYKIEFEEGAAVDADTLAWIKGLGHEQNMTNAQLQGLVLGYNAESVRIQEEQQAALDVQNQTEEVELRNTWGTKYDERLDYGHRALLALGLQEENIDSIQSALGPKATAELAAKIADTMGEDTIAAQTQTPAFGTSKEQIQTRINALNAELGGDTKRFDRYREDHATHKHSPELTDKDFRTMKLLEKQLQDLLKAGA